MRTGQTYRDILKQVSETGRKRKEMIGIIFAHPEHKIVKSEIIPFFSHMDIRSGNYVDFYFAGYLNKRELDLSIHKNHEEIEIKYSKNNIYFSENSFIDLMNDVENKSKWKRTGGVDFLLIDVVNNKLDYSNCIEIELSIAREEKRIPMLSIFFESIFRFSQEHGRNKRTWVLSDKQLPSLALSTLENIMPSGLFSLYKNGSIYAVKNLSK